jgi:hypothetical protein
MQVKGKVIKGWLGVPSTPTMEVKEVLAGPQNSSKAEKVVLVSMRREIGLPSMMAITMAPVRLWLSGLGVLGSISHQP